MAVAKGVISAPKACLQHFFFTHAKACESRPLIASVDEGLRGPFFGVGIIGVINWGHYFLSSAKPLQIHYTQQFYSFGEQYLQVVLHYNTLAKLAPNPMRGL